MKTKYQLRLQLSEQQQVKPRSAVAISGREGSAGAAGLKPGAPLTALGMKERDGESRAESGNKALNKSQVQDPEDGEVRFSSDGEFRYYTGPI